MSRLRLIALLLCSLPFGLAAAPGKLLIKEGDTLTFDGKRFNDEGSRLLVEAILRATGKQEVITPEQRATWANRPAYWRKQKNR